MPLTINWSPIENKRTSSGMVGVGHLDWLLLVAAVAESDDGVDVLSGLVVALAIGTAWDEPFGATYGAGIDAARLWLLTTTPLINIVMRAKFSRNT